MINMPFNNFHIRLILIFALLFPMELFAQEKQISGVITDAAGGQALAGATIRLIPGSGASSDASGRFNIKIIPDLPPSKIIVSAIGYVTDTVFVNEGFVYNIQLIPSKELLNEVIVTGISKATLARENPIAVVAISRKALDHTIESNIIDVLVKNVPGLNAVNTGPNVSKPFIRGLGYNRVLTLYDGVRQEGQQWGDEHGLEADAYNIEKGEVIKGPASLMFGSDAIAGVVSIMSSLPHTDDGKIHGRFLSEYQSNNGLWGNGLLLTKLSGQWAYALRGSYRIAKNYRNDVDGRVYNTGFRETNASGTVRYSKGTGSSDFSLSLYNNLQGIPDGSRDSLSRAFTKQVAEGNNDDIKNRPLVTEQELNNYALSPLHQHISHNRIFTNHHYQVGNGEIDALVALQQNIRKEYNHPTEPVQPGMFVKLNTLNYAFRYTVELLPKTELVTGVNGMYQQNTNKNATDFPIPDYSLFDAGAFLFSKWKNNNWTVSGGFRYDIRQLKGRDFYTLTNDSTGFKNQVFVPDTAGAYLQFPSFNTSFNGISLSLGATYRISDKISLKANIARGYRAPSITEFASNGLDPGAHIIYLGDRNFKPEFNLQTDLGADYHDKNITASISIFNNNIHQYIYLSALTDINGDVIVNPQGNKTYQYQQSSAQLYGMEAVINLQPERIKGLTINNAISLIYGYNRQAGMKGQGIEGEYLPLIPPLKWLGSIGQTFHLKSENIPTMGITLEVNMNAAQKRFLALNDTETYTPGFTLVNLAFNTSIKYYKNKFLEFQLQANNIFDLAYQSNLSRLKYFEYYSSSPTGKYGIYSMGRNICAKLILPF